MSFYTYLIVLSGSLVGPLLFSFLPQVRFYKKWWAALSAAIVSSGIFIPWDAWFASKGVWGFSREHITGLFLFGLPVEECLFFLVIPFACLFVYECIAAFPFFPRRWYIYSVPPIVLRVISVLFLLSVPFSLEQWYTTSVLMGTGIFLFLGSFYPVARQLQWGQFLLAYLVVCTPFLVVNGLLTFIPVVWYNPVHCSGLRVVSIPLEDFLYNFMLFFTNVLLYRIVLSRTGKRQSS